MKKIEKYGVFEAVLNCEDVTDLIAGEAVFKRGTAEKRVRLFKNHSGEYMVRFMPQMEGIWSYQIMIGTEERSGKFECTAARGENHGVVHAEGDHFQYQDGSTYIPVGTTCYAWIHQTEELQEETLDTLAESPFNKIRMCVFPKSMPYNNNEPDCYPFLKKEDGSWEVNDPDPVFWEKLDKRIKQLMELGIEADLILFHPYDRWGFSKLTQMESRVYLEYCIARLSAYRNLWWSLANEYEVLYEKSLEDWDEYGKILMEKDIYVHLISIHDIIAPYPKRTWMTHCSIQSGELHRIIFWKREYGIPIIIDECGYEGDLPYNWGNLSAFEMVHRFWWTVYRGGFCTHGETYDRSDEVLWWAKGGQLYGESVKRIAFLKELLYSLPGQWKASETVLVNPNQDEKTEDATESPFHRLLKKASPEAQDNYTIANSPMKLEGKTYELEYFGRYCPGKKELHLPENGSYKVEIIDIWEMTRRLSVEGINGKVKIGLPAKEGIALLVMKENYVSS